MANHSPGLILVPAVLAVCLTGMPSRTCSLVPAVSYLQSRVQRLDDGNVWTAHVAHEMVQLYFVLPSRWRCDFSTHFGGYQLFSGRHRSYGTARRIELKLPLYHPGADTGGSRTQSQAEVIVLHAGCSKGCSRCTASSVFVVEHRQCVTLSIRLDVGSVVCLSDAKSSQ